MSGVRPIPFKMKTQKSLDLYARACEVIPGGVNSPVRAFKGVGGKPPFIVKGQGARLYDADGNAYLDYVGSWGPLILGHAPAGIIAAAIEAIKDGLSFGAPTEIEVRVAEKIRSLMPSLEMVRMVNSGTEATMSAIRLARGYTGRDKIIKFDGCYHGHADGLLAGAGSGVLTCAIPGSPGVPAATAADTLVLDYNDAEQVERAFERWGKEIACVIVEPIAGNMNLVPGDAGFLQTLRKLCDAAGSLLIFDEVMTGFRVALGGAQSLYDVRPDLTTLGKVIGGGMPVGAFGGAREIMSALAPAGPVYQAGTLSGNPVAMHVGLKTLEAVETPGFYASLSEKAAALCDGLSHAAGKNGVAFYGDYRGGMFGLFFARGPIRTFEQVKAADGERFSRFHRAMLERGVYFAPSPFEAGFVSAAHTTEDVAATVDAAAEAMATLKDG